jgi:hypothetical protein
MAISAATADVSVRINKYLYYEDYWLRGGWLNSLRMSIMSSTKAPGLCGSAKALAQRRVAELSEALDHFIHQGDKPVRKSSSVHGLTVIVPSLILV